MSLAKLQEGLTRFTENDKAGDILTYVNEFINEQQKQYTINKDNDCLTFGKWKGFTIKEMSTNEKGKQYVGWLLTQPWFTEDKFSNLFEDMRHNNLLKKT